MGLKFVGLGFWVLGLGGIEDKAVRAVAQSGEKGEGNKFYRALLATCLMRKPIFIFFWGGGGEGSYDDFINELPYDYY